MRFLREISISNLKPTSEIGLNYLPSAVSACTCSYISRMDLFFVTAPLQVGGRKPFKARWLCSATPPAIGTPARGENARRFAKWIAAEWSNKEQAMENPQFWSHIHVAFRPLPWKLLNGYAFYTESAYEYDLGTPYKTSVVQVVNDGKGQLELSSYKLRDADEFWMGVYEPSLLEGLQTDNLAKMAEVCNTVFVWDENRKMYEGRSRPGKGCRIRRAGTTENTYLDSEIELKENEYSAWDVGRDVETDVRIWGPGAGAFVFSAVQRFGDLIPDEPEEETQTDVQVAGSKILD